MRTTSFSKMVCMILVVCGAAIITSFAQTLTTLTNFTGANGADPVAPLIQGTDGNFYGTTSQGGSNGSCGGYGCGTVYRMTASGALTPLYSFCSQSNCLDGAYPEAGLLQGDDGNFYGTTAEGGGGSSCGLGCGTVFKITPSGMLTTLYSFCSQPNCTDGAGPNGLVKADDGNFYGTTIHGGLNGSCGGLGCGTVFKITPSGALTTLHTFDITDGVFPEAGLMQASDGNFYGTTYQGGANNGCNEACGTVFKITSGGTLTTLHTFQGYPSDGSQPEAALVQGTDGNLYGTTSIGGTNGAGTIFKITPDGTLTTIYSFCPQQNCPDGAIPNAALLQATDGNFYGTTTAGGNAPDGGDGTIFKVSPSGVLNTLYSFCSQLNCTDGNTPAAGLVQATTGIFYGTTAAGGSSGGNGDGTVFSFSVGISLSPVQFVPVTPCRLVDTRTQNGGGGPIQGGNYQTFNLPQLAQTKGCGDLSTAGTYSLNVTLIPQNGAPVSYLTIWPAGRNQPLVSTMNSLDGRIKANAAIVPAGASGAVSVYVTNTANVVLDIDGYFAPANGSSLAFYPLPPCRIVDTRLQDGDLGGPFLQGTRERDFPILESSCIPLGVTPNAYSFNVTVVPHPAHQPLSYLTVWPVGVQQPLVSTLNNLTGTIVANAAIVPAGTNGAVAVYPTNDTDLIIDVNGYFDTPGSGGLSLYPTAPCRVIDTRKVGNGQPFIGELTVDVINGPCSPPANAQAYVFNVTVVPPGALGYLTLWPDGGDQPLVSTLNAIDGSITSNMAIVPTNNGSIDAYASSLTQMILDISSYFAP